MDFLKRHIATGISVALHSALLLGVVVCVLAVVIAWGWLNSAGWLARAVPPAPTLSPVKIRIHGPTMIVRGGQYMFVAEVSGPAGNPEWSMLPLGAGALHVSADGKSAEFSTLDAEQLALIVSVAGDGKQIAHDHIQVEVLDVHQPEPPAPPAPQVPAALSMPAPPTLTELTIGALESVESDDRQAEARTVAGSIRSLVSRIKIGQLAADADLVGEIGRQIDAAFVSSPERARRWAPFIAALDTILDYETASGHVTAASKAEALSKIADVLQQAQ